MTHVQRSLTLTLGLLAIMFTLVAFSPQLYNLFCRVTGFGGTPQLDPGGQISASAAALESDLEFTLLFQARVSGGLAWDFEADQRRARVGVNQLKPATYTARNQLRAPLVGEAIFSVTPAEIAPYLVKVECFCFTRQELGPLEEVTMPLQVYISPDILDDPIARDVRRITLHYEFTPRD